MRILAARHALPADQKPESDVQDDEVSPAGTAEGEQQSWNTGSFQRDAAAMRKLGIKQETKRRFGFVTILGFTTTMMSTWESALPFFLTAFLNGGGPTMLYGFIVAFVGALATCASMAEMASMYPISGGQYHWSALLAPKKQAKFLSWLTGWISTLGWQASAATGTYLGATSIQSLIAINNPDYTAPRWQGTLLLFAVLALTLLVNTVLVKIFPGLEGMILILHVIGFFAILIPIVHLAPISPNHFVWTDFIVYSGYPSGLAWLIGQSGSAILFIGYDGACHMAEEVKDAAINVPRAMFSTILINGSFGFATYIFILYCFGNPMDVLSFQGLAFVEIFMNATHSAVGTSVMTALLLTLYVSATFCFVASASRQAWAFSRDGGLPLSKIFKKIDTRWSIPLYTIALTGTINALLGLLYLGSSVAFNAVVSLTTASYLSSYLIPIVLMIIRRMRGEHINFGPWRLGRWGLPINIFAAIYTLVTVVFSFFPPSIDPPINAMNMNYACLVYGGVILIGIVYYFVIGHRSYVGPSVEIDIPDAELER